MQVSVEKISEISRKMTVSVPEDVIQQKISDRLKALAGKVKVDGFRPGKVPANVVKKMYGETVRNEVTGDLIESTYKEAIKDQALQPVGYPQIQSTDQDEQGFKYIVEFEVYPEISLAEVENISLIRPFAKIEDVDIDNMFMKLRKQHITWHVVERGAEKSDRVYINFSGVVEGENFTDGIAENVPVEIGAQKMISGFEDNLIGLVAGDHKTFEITFPEDYGNEKLAGKLAEFTVDVLKIEESHLPEIDAEFAKTYGIENGDLDAFNAGVSANMQWELNNALQNKLRTAVMDALYAAIPVELPNSLVNNEIQNLLKPYAENAKKQNIKIEDLQLPKEVFEAQAKRRVALGLILNAIVHKNALSVDANKVRETIENLSQSYEDPAGLVNWYYADKTRLTEIEQYVLEEMAVAWVVAKATVTDQTIGFDAAMSAESLASVES